jgi:predicted lipoprotein with Yx(FWY)xxD motif
MRHMVIAIAVALTAALAVSSTGHAAGSAAAVKTRHGKLGTFLVDGHGRTLYLFQKDKTARSTCSGACATDWPPLLTAGKAKGSGGARKALLGTTKRSDGTTQVTYKGHPLYTYIGDTKAGDTNGQGVSAFGARWYAVGPAGRRVGSHY